jgi:hypothetical protein
MSGFHIPVSAKRIKVLGLSGSARKAESLAQFGTPIQESDLVFLAGNGFRIRRTACSKSEVLGALLGIGQLCVRFIFRRKGS